MDVLKEVLAEIKPTKEEDIFVDKRIKEFMSRIKVKEAKVILGGSGAKGTWLKTTNDADIFVLFDYNKYMGKSDELSDILEKQLKKSFKKLIRLHGSRDYFQVKENNFTFEIVPILGIKNSKEAVNITDVSPLHAVFVKGAINKNKKLADEIRLMKQFCKSNKVYGAESYINGFSGYMCEVLTIYYGSFSNLMKAAAKWQPKTIVDAKNFYKSKNVLMEMNKSKTVSPLVLVDPVQKDRNAAAALSLEKYDLFRKKAQEFIKKPSSTFFEIRDFDIEKLKHDFIVIEAEVLEGKEDIVGAKLVKVFNCLRKGLENADFKIAEDGWQWDKGPKAYFYFKAPKDLDKEMTVEGPPANLKDFVLNFKKKHKKTFVKGEKIYAKEKRNFVKAIDLVKELLKNEYVKERVKSIKLV
jgi:tRNA nucleotidyltransferase (CCA-adding enzyme)